MILIIVVTLFFLFSLIGINFFESYNDIFYKVTSYYGLIAFIGALIGLDTSKKWGGMKSVVGRCLIFFSSGLMAQVFGQIVYTVSIDILKVEVPYPSLGDVGFFGSVIFYILGILSLGQAVGVKLEINIFKNKAISILIPLILLITSYAIFLSGYEFDFNKPLAIFLDFGYPLGQSLYISLAIVVYALSRKFLGGVMRKSVLILLLALVLQYFADFSFLYLVSIDRWQPAGITDLFYIVSYLLMALAINEIRRVSDKLNV